MAARVTLPPIRLDMQDFQGPKHDQLDILKDLCRAYQTYAGCMTVTEQQEFAELLRNRRYRHSAPSEKFPSQHSIYQLIWNAPTCAVKRANFTFPIWLMLATLYDPTRLHKIAFLALDLFHDRRPCFEMYASHHKTHLSELCISDFKGIDIRPRRYHAGRPNKSSAWKAKKTRIVTLRVQSLKLREILHSRTAGSVDDTGMEGSDGTGDTTIQTSKKASVFDIASPNNVSYASIGNESAVNLTVEDPQTAEQTTNPNPDAVLDIEEPPLDRLDSVGIEDHHKLTCQLDLINKKIDDSTQLSNDAFTALLKAYVTLTQAFTQSRDENERALSEIRNELRNIRNLMQAEQ